MIQKEIRAAIEGFINLLENGLNDEQANIHALELNLDNLALAYHFAEVVFEDYDSEASSPDYNQLKHLAISRFPGFGYYNEPKNITEKIGEADILIGDALDDIADITRDLYEVLWYWENESEKVALWKFCFGYEHHWGAHLRSLQSYLYAVLYK
jgi:hypothetical protein